MCERVREKLIHISRLINRYSDRLQTAPSRMRLFYHAPCHLKAQPEPDSSIQLLRSLKGAVIEHPGHPLLRHGRRMGPVKGSFRLEPCHRIGHDSAAQCLPRGCRRNRLPDMRHADVPVQPQTDPASRGNHRRSFTQPCILSEQDRASDSVPDSTKEMLHGKNTDCRR